MDKRCYIDGNSYSDPDDIKRILRKHKVWYRTRKDGVIEYQYTDKSEVINWADYGYTDI